MSELRTTRKVARHGRLSITKTLMGVMSLLVLVSVGSVLWIGIWLAQKNTFALLSDNVNQSVNTTVNSVKQYLGSVEHKAQFLAERISGGVLDPADSDAMEDMFTGVLAGAAQIDRLEFVDTNLKAFYVSYRRRKDEITSGFEQYAWDSLIANKVERLSPGANWGEPLWQKKTGKTQLELIYPVYRDDKLIGVIVALLPVRHISVFVGAEQSNSMGSLFVLSGRERVMGHPLMRKRREDMNQDSPLPMLKRFDDPVLASFWDIEERGELRRLDLPEGIEGHMQRVAGVRYVFVYKQIEGFGPEPLIIGGYFPRSQFGEEVQRLILATAVGIVALLLAMLAAMYLGRKIAQPITSFSAAASRVRNLELSEVQELGGSPFKELDEQSSAFNAMLRALRWFELYVPNRVVAHLIKRGDAGQTISDAREVAVMFTDIVGFSGLSEGMSAREVAEFLNHHFGLIGRCIYAEQGTIDKYIGDSVMAFWGAPEEQLHRAERACRTALAVAASIRADNRLRVELGKPAIGIRIGIHCGEVTVGNIGAPGRINYTAIGDVVNVSARLEQLGKELNPQGTEVSVLISGETRNELGDDFSPVALGAFKLKGRDNDVEVFRLA